jgi:hypothetical protein
MKKFRIALGIAFAAALGLGYGCGGNNSTSPPFTLGGKTYTEKYTCNQTFTGTPVTCPDVNLTDTLLFQSTGPNTFVVHDVPDTGFVYNGTMVGQDFNWTATSPDGYTESGTWVFSVGSVTFSGSSHYTANDGSYVGDCNTNGVIGTGTAPPNPPPPSGCP